MKFSKKTAHRLLMFLGMFAPIAYLFGSMFFALNGSHSAFPFSADYDVVVGSESYLLNQQIPNSDFSSSTYWTSNSAYSSLSISNNIARSTQTGAPVYWYDNGVQSVSNTDIVIGHKYFYRYFVEANISGSYTFYNSNLGYGRDVSVPSNTKTAVYGVLNGFREGRSVNLLIDRNGLSRSVGDYSEYSNLVLVDLTLMYGVGLEPDDQTFNAWLGDSYIAFDKNGTYFTVPLYGQPDNGQYVFNQFFPKGNFLERIGENALSEAPVGFAPFSAMFRYLDSSVFHGSNSQIALMVYGEIYWALHVVMADLVYHVLVWIPNLVNRVFDWFDSKGLSDE